MMHFRERTFQGNPKHWAEKIRQEWRREKRYKHYRKSIVTQPKHQGSK